jgi:hypothetical protein
MLNLILLYGNKAASNSSHHGCSMARTHWIGGWASSRVRLDVEAKKKNPFPGGNETPVIKSIASVFTD